MIILPSWSKHADTFGNNKQLGQTFQLAEAEANDHLQFPGYSLGEARSLFELYYEGK